MMKLSLSFLSLLVVTAAHAHESLAPHHHPHEVSMLPDSVTVIVGIVVLAAACVAAMKFRRR